MPGFFFSNPVVAGFVAMIMLPVFGAAAFVFVAQIGTEANEVFDAARSGAIIAVALGVIIYGAIFISALVVPEERSARLQFVLGGALGLGAIFVLDTYASDYVRGYLAGGGFGMAG